MANTLKKIFVPGLDQVAQTYTIESWHVSQSVDAFTGTEAYDIILSGSLTLTGSLFIDGLTDPSLTNVLTIDTSTGQIYYTSSTAIAPINNYISSTVTNNYTSSTVNNNYGTSSIVNNYTASTVNNPGGSDTQVQYNSGSAFGASPSFTYDYTIESLAQGNNVLASGNYSHAQGIDVTASANFSHAEGIITKANGIGSHAEGSGTTATGDSSHAEGEETTAQGIASHTEGFETLTSGDYAHAEGDNTVASGQGSHAEGYQTVASGPYSHAEGYQTIALGQASHAEGRDNLASGDYSYTSGYQNTSSGNYSFTTGLQNKATNTYTFAAGLQNIVSGNGSAVFGYGNFVSGQSALAIGYTNFATGQYSFASGWGTKAQGFSSFTSGLRTSASGDYQTVVGAFNELNTSPNAFIVGGGTSLGSVLKTLVFASGSQFQLSGSFAPQYRNIGNIQVSPASSGVAVTSRDYNVGFNASNVTVIGRVNRIQLPSNVPVGTVIYLQRVEGQTTPFNSASTIQISGSSGHTINGAAGYTFPTTRYARRMFVFNGTGWFVEPTTIA
jgi:hypothetical protein